MELILLNDVTNVGRKGDVVKVSDGYARNYLFPRKLAIPATRSNEKFVQEQKERNARRKAKEKEAAQEKAKQLSKLKVTIEARAGEQGKLFGSVTAEDISEALKSHHYEIDKKRVHLKDPIRSIGSYPVSVELYPEVKAMVSVEVVEKPEASN